MARGPIAPMAVMRQHKPLLNAIGWGPASDFNGAIAIVTNPTSWHDAQVGDIVMHAPNSGNHDVAWTSPEAGFIVLSGKVWDAFFASGRDSSWVLKVNGTTIASRNTIFGTFRTDAVADIANNLALGQSLGPIPVAANDMVTLSTVKNTVFGHFAGVELNIELTVIPEPASLGLLALGAVLLAQRRYPRIPA